MRPSPEGRISARIQLLLTHQSLSSVNPSLIPPTPYNLEVMAPGILAFRDFHNEIGTVSERVEVSVAILPLNTESGAIVAQPFIANSQGRTTCSQSTTAATRLRLQ